MKKLGFIVMALVLALGTVGVGYAMWQDDIVIIGEVQTGSLGIDVEYVSGVDAYKNLDTNQLVMSYWVRECDNETVLRRDGGPAYNPLNPDHLMVGNATASCTGDDEVTMTYTNIFPTVYQGGANGFYCDIIALYTGTIPAHVHWDWQVDNATQPEMAWLFENGYIDIYAFNTTTTRYASYPYLYYTVPLGTHPELTVVQLHDGDEIKLNVYIDLPQCDELMAGGKYLYKWPYGPKKDSPIMCEDFMGLMNASFMIKIHATQFNEGPPLP